MAGRGERFPDYEEILRARGVGIGRGRPADPPLNAELIEGLQQQHLDEEAQAEIGAVLFRRQAREERAAKNRIDRDNEEATANLAEVERRRAAVRLMTTRIMVDRSANSLEDETREMEVQREIQRAERRIRRN